LASCLDKAQIMLAALKRNALSRPMTNLEEGLRRETPRKIGRVDSRQQVSLGDEDQTLIGPVNGA
jgi:hypothetical protein